MEKINFAGIEINRVPFAKLFLTKTMLLAYILLLGAAIGIYELFDLRYFGAVVNAHDAGIDPTNPAMKEAMRQAIFGTVGEIDRNLPWTILIANYMYMIYTGSGIIFLVALAELLKIKIIAQAAAGFMTAGLSLVLAGLFTIATDLNLLNIHWMFLSANFKAGMWMMMPLYSVYIPFVLFEIYLLITKRRELARKLALPLLLLSVGVDIIEYYIQAKLFAMNTARHLWTDFPFLTLYFIISAFVAGLGLMGLLSWLNLRKDNAYPQLMEIIRRGLLLFIIILGLYEFIAYGIASTEHTLAIVQGPFKLSYFGGYILLGIALPLFLCLKKERPTLTLIASFLTLIGGFIGRYIFVYGGNAVPMSNRSGTGFEHNEIYGMTKSFIYTSPHLGEILIVIGSIGVAIIMYRLFDQLFSVSSLRNQH